MGFRWGYGGHAWSTANRSTKIKIALIIVAIITIPFIGKILALLQPMPETTTVYDNYNPQTDKPTMTTLTEAKKPAMDRFILR